MKTVRLLPQIYKTLNIKINENLHFKKSDDRNRGKSLLEEKFWLKLKNTYLIQFSSVQFSSVAQSCLTLCNPMNRSRPGLPVHHQLPEFTQTHVHQSVMPSSPLILCRPLLLLPPILPSIRVFSNESTLHMRWPKY